MIGRLLSRLAGAGAARPRLAVAIAVALGVGAAAVALRLHATAATSTFVSSSSRDYHETQRFYESFGEEPIVVLVKGDLQQLVLSSDIERLLGLEGCLSGNVPAPALAHEGGVRGPCGQLARARTVKVVFGPGTFINEAAAQINEQLTSQTRNAEAQARQAEAVVVRAALARGLGAAEAHTLGSQARRITIARFQEGLVRIALQYGLTARPSIADPSFVSTLVFDSSKPAGTPKQRFAYLFPNRGSALVSVRMRAGLDDAQRTRTIALIREAVAMPQWHLQHGERYLVTGVPAIASELPAAIGRSVALLMVAVVLLMAATLGLVFVGRPRLLPLGLALLAAAITFGGLSLAGASVTMASVAVLPVLVGLAVDYAIQLQTRLREAVEADGADVADRAARVRLLSGAAGRGGATIATAAAASAAAILVLLLSPVPMVRGFGVLLVVGLAIALVCALVVAPAAMVGAGRGPRPRERVLGGAPRGLAAVYAARAPAGLSAAWGGAAEILRDNAITRFVERVALRDAVRRPGLVLSVGLLLAALGWGLDTQTRVETDITKLVPQDLGSLRALNTLERTTGVAGEIDLRIAASDVATPSTIEWMTRYQAAVLRRFGYGSSHGCGKARVCPAFSLPDLFRGASASSSTAAAGGAGGGGSTRLTRSEVDSLLAAIPPYFSQDVITPDHRVATLAFGIRVMSLTEQERLVEEMRSMLHPPRGVSAALVGLPVLAARSASEVADPWRRLLTLVVGLAAAGAVLLIAFRGELRRALTPLVPVVLATGWSALVLFAVRVPLNPMSVTLAALVIAISTEFSVLLCERHRAERRRGAGTATALRETYRRTGSAVAASGVTAIAGFGVLVFSEIAMLRDFGIVTLIDLTVSLVGVLVAVPAAIVILEGERGREVSAPGAERSSILRRALPPVLRRGTGALSGASSAGGEPGHETL